MKAFEIRVDGKILDYRLGKNLNLEEVKKFFEKKYNVGKIWQEKRHVVGILKKDGFEYFLKLAPTEGVSAVTQIEANWNDEFNKLVSRDSTFWVPKNLERGFYKENLFYIVTDYFEGQLFAKRPTPGKIEQILIDDLPKIIELSELIQNLEINEISEKDRENYSEWFLEKTKSWLNEVPKKIIERYEVDKLLRIVQNGNKTLERKTRHGDFTPWHMCRLENDKIGLIDGEHAMRSGVEYYDIGYLIQRIYSVMENPEFAKNILEILLKREYNLEKLKVILAARAIGGFCDEALINEDQNFERANRFKEWVLSL